MRAVGYCRVSTEGQADGFGLDVQRTQVREHCEAHGHELVAIHSDTTSGTNGLDERDGLIDALAAVKDGEAQLLVFPRLDRLARDLGLQEQILSEVWKHGGEVASCSAGETNLRDDPEDPTRTMIRQVLGAVAAYERAMIVLRTKRGRAAKARGGGFAYGSPPYGYRSDGNGGLEEHPEEQDGLHLIAELRRQGFTIEQIMIGLNDRGVPTKRGGDFRWSKSTVTRVLNRMSVERGAAADEPAP